MSECIPGAGSLNSSGYRQVSVDVDGKRKQMLAHRYAWEQATGRTIPMGGVVRHTCDNKQCVNPEHLLLGTVRDNVMDAVQRRLHRNSRKTHCPQGHEYSEKNTYVTANNWRICRPCHAERARMDRAQAKEDA